MKLPLRKSNAKTSCDSMTAECVALQAWCSDTSQYRLLSHEDRPVVNAPYKMNIAQY